MPTLTENQKLGKFTVQTLIKENLYTETYRAVDEDNNPYFLKLFIIKKMPTKLINPETGNVFEVEYSRKLVHKNIVSYIDSGSLELESVGECQYYLTNYFSGELLADKIRREGKLAPELALVIYKGILEGLAYMHGQELYHNDITPRNIMLPSSAEPAPEIIDLGHVSVACNGKVTFDTSDLELLYSANESTAGIYDAQSDIFAATAVLYAMLTGTAPWTPTFAEGMKYARKAMILKEFRSANPLNTDVLPVDDNVKAVILKGLALSYKDRYENVAKILHDLDSGEAPSVSDSRPKSDDMPAQKSLEPGDQSSGPQSPNAVDFDFRKGRGNGFADIAGMKELKDYLYQRVIFIIKDKDKVKKYKLSAPNGMLLYGPPGCGKTFVAEKFAEETGFNYILVKSSDLSSSFVHGSQEKIAQLFKQAEQKAPVVICFDEFDALVPDRSSPGAQHTASEVNEFLTQLNNCSDRGIFVVGTTNRPDKIDSAILRTGRMDKQVYVPLPDKEARREMFIIHMRERPYNPEAIDFDKLAELSEGYIASDIAFVVNEAAIVAAFTDQDITEELLVNTLGNIRPSLRPDVLEMYDEIRRMMDSTERANVARRRIGFVQNNK